MKSKSVTATQLMYSIYYDDTPIANDILLDSAVGDPTEPNSAEDPTRQMGYLSDNLAATMVFLIGTTTRVQETGYACISRIYN